MRDVGRKLFNQDMIHKQIGLIGILTAAVFLAGFLTLFIYNPQTRQELNNLSLSSYNLIGMKGQAWTAYVNYLTVGLLNTFFAIGLFWTTKNKSIIVAGKILLLLTGLIWTSYGLVPTDLSNDSGMHLMMISVFSMLITGPAGLIILGAEFEQIFKDKFSKYYTLSTGLVILFIGFLSVFVFNDETWIRTNISLTIYFIWFGVFGIKILQKKPAPNSVFMPTAGDSLN